jgi:hypothetical protein
MDPNESYHMITYIGNGESSSFKVGHLDHVHFVFYILLASLETDFREVCRGWSFRDLYSARNVQ